ncbi:MAG: accessory gene regulator B family protein [Mucispirillum schaedleri]|nr:accessory gene regulator B family protein [Mucispirillum schaedleri]
MLGSDVEIYKYGYYLLFEKVLIFIITVFITIILKAWQEIFLFYIAFVPVRVYLGGYHAKKTINCIVLSSLILIVNVMAVRLLNIITTGIYPVILEIVFFIILRKVCPVETENRKISRSEKRYFSRMASKIYLTEIVLEVLLMQFGFSNSVNSFVSAHCTNVMVVLAGLACNYINKNNR